LRGVLGFLRVGTGVTATLKASPSSKKGKRKRRLRTGKHHKGAGPGKGWGGGLVWTRLVSSTGAGVFKGGKGLAASGRGMSSGRNERDPRVIQTKGGKKLKGSPLPGDRDAR